MRLSSLSSSIQSTASHANETKGAVCHSILWFINTNKFLLQSPKTCLCIATKLLLIKWGAIHSGLVGLDNVSCFRDSIKCWTFTFGTNTNLDIMHCTLQLSNFIMILVE
jgi:hypothetical protein